MMQMDVTQRQLINLFVQFGLCSEQGRDALRSKLSYALTGKRQTKAYKKLLDDINFVLDSL